MQSNIIFNNKMQKPIPCLPQSDQIFSPKQSQQREIRAITLQKIDTEIQSIIAINIQQHSQYKDFNEKLNMIENLYLKQNGELRQEITRLTQRYEELEKLYLATKQELISQCDALQEIQSQKSKREKQIIKLKTMIKNQQSLIDEYKRNLHDELDLEKELIKSTFDQQKLQLEKEFNHALLQMEKQYEDKIKKMMNSLKMREYHSEFQDLRKYLLNNKENHEKAMKKSSSFVKKPIFSQYSTNDNDPKQTENERRHHQAVFIP